MTEAGYCQSTRETKTAVLGNPNILLEYSRWIQTTFKFKPQILIRTQYLKAVATFGKSINMLELVFIRTLVLEPEATSGKSKNMLDLVAGI